MGAGSPSARSKQDPGPRRRQERDGAAEEVRRHRQKQIQAIAPGWGIWSFKNWRESGRPSPKMCADRAVACITRKPEPVYPRGQVPRLEKRGRTTRHAGGAHVRADVKASRKEAASCAGGIAAPSPRPGERDANDVSSGERPAKTRSLLLELLFARRARVGSESLFTGDDFSPLLA